MCVQVNVFVTPALLCVYLVHFCNPVSHGKNEQTERCASGRSLTPNNHRHWKSVNVNSSYSCKHDFIHASVWCHVWSVLRCLHVCLRVPARTCQLAFPLLYIMAFEWSSLSFSLCLFPSLVSLTFLWALCYVDPLIKIKRINLFVCFIFFHDLSQDGYRMKDKTKRIKLR